MSNNKKKIAILGSTGSIGKNTLKILEKYSKLFSVDLLCCNRNKSVIIKQIIKFLPKYVIISDFKTYEFVKNIKFKKKIIFFQNINDFNLFFKFKKKIFDKVILSISSINGIDFAFSFLKFSKELLIANKETIVCGGKFFIKEAKRSRCQITSIDSEHFCISNVINFYKKKEINKIYLTASGGPFLSTNINQISKANIKSALNHPNWKMGKKISIDSATMANKGLEVIEASILFDLKPKDIKVKIHKESKIHAVIILKNNLVIMVGHNTSMSIPIENALTKSKKSQNIDNFFFNKKNFVFNFDEINLKKFKMLSLAYKALYLGPRGCIFFNVVNDYLVNLFLNKKIFFYEIQQKLNKVINNKKLHDYFKKKINNLNQIHESIYFAKKICKKI